MEVPLFKIVGSNYCEINKQLYFSDGLTKRAGSIKRKTRGAGAVKKKDVTVLPTNQKLHIPSVNLLLCY